MVLLPNKSTADYFFAKAEQSFRRSRTNSNARNKLEALGNAFMVKAVELDVELKSRQCQLYHRFARPGVTIPTKALPEGAFRGGRNGADNIAS